MIESEKLYRTISSLISPDDFTEGIYRTVAELLYEQHENGGLNPAKILDHFTAEEEHRRLRPLSHEDTPAEFKRRRGTGAQRDHTESQSHGIDAKSSELDPTDMAGLQRLMEEKRKLEDLRALHISID